MLKTLGAQIKEFKKDSILTPVFMLLEVIMETIIPLMMASIIDDGVNKGNVRHIYIMGAAMAVIACISLYAGVMGGKYGARASAGLQEISEKPCTVTYRHIHFQISTSSVQRDLLQDLQQMLQTFRMHIR